MALADRISAAERRLDQRRSDVPLFCETPWDVVIANLPMDVMYPQQAGPDHEPAR